MVRKTPSKLACFIRFNITPGYSKVTSAVWYMYMTVEYEKLVVTTWLLYMYNFALHVSK